MTPLDADPLRRRRHRLPWPVAAVLVLLTSGVLWWLLGKILFWLLP
ncbi:hypothetical protein [Roseomonas sp. KE2513]|nr:hypothetical protein [Roseomonas sp. KE2513]